MNIPNNTIRGVGFLVLSLLIFSLQDIAIKWIGGNYPVTEIEYFMGNLATNMVYAWTDEDEQLSELMQQYYSNFVRSSDPNGPGLPPWQPSNAGDSVQLMRLDIKSASEPDRHRARYLLLDELIGGTLAR